MVSVICCYNKAQEYSKMLQTLKMQSVAWEVIGVDNTDQTFSSAAAALNYGASKSTGDILVFLHQDVLFLEPNALESLIAPISLCGEDICVVGPYGAEYKKGGEFKGYKVNETLDECCIAMYRNTFTKFPFNVDLCDGWHLYAAELCLRVDMAGGKVLSGNFPVVHLSTGNVDDAYMKTFYRIMKHYKEKRWIATTCKSLPNNEVAFFVYWILWKAKKVLLGNFGLIAAMKNYLRFWEKQ